MLSLPPESPAPLPRDFTIYTICLVCGLHLCHVLEGSFSPSFGQVTVPEKVAHERGTLTLVVLMSHTLPSSWPVGCPSSSKKLPPSAHSGVCGAQRHLVATEKRRILRLCRAAARKSFSPAEETIRQAVTPGRKHTQDRHSISGSAQGGEPLSQTPLNSQERGSLFPPWSHHPHWTDGSRGISSRLRIYNHAQAKGSQILMRVDTWGVSRDPPKANKIRHWSQDRCHPSPTQFPPRVLFS